MASPAPPSPEFHPGTDAGRILAAVLEGSVDAIVGFDREGTIVLWGRGAEHLFGYTPAEIVGRPFATLLPSGAGRDGAGILERVAAGVRLESRGTRGLTRDGRTVELLLTVIPVASADGAIAGAVALAVDLPSANRYAFALRSVEARWRAIIDSAVDGIVVIDAAGVIEAVNPAAERMFGFSEAELAGRNVSMLMPSPYREEHDGYIARYLSTGERRIIGVGREVIGLRRDGRTFPVHLSVGEIQLGDERHFTGILHDLSARAALEEQLRERTTLARLGEMAAVIAHEVKNPLAAVKGAVQVIGRRLPPDSREASVVHEIVARLDALNALIQDLLLFARPPQPRRTAVDLRSLLDLTAAFLAGDPALAGVRVRTDGPPAPVMGDPELLKIAVQNLLINAGQAMAGVGTITATVTAEGDAYAVRVADEGPGMPPEVREKLFKPFFTTKARGTGLGLSIARRIVDAHDGSIAVECPQGGGTVVTLRIPAT